MLFPEVQDVYVMFQLITLSMDVRDEDSYQEEERNKMDCATKPNPPGVGLDMVV